MRASAKAGKAATHPLLGDELRAPRQLKRSQPRPSSSLGVVWTIFPLAEFAQLLASAGDEQRLVARSTPELVSPRHWLWPHSNSH